MTERVFVPRHPNWAILLQRDSEERIVESPCAIMVNTKVRLEIINDSLIVNGGDNALLIPFDVIRLLKDYTISYESHCP